MKNRPADGRFFTSMKITTRSGVSCVLPTSKIAYTTSMDVTDAHAAVSLRAWGAGTLPTDRVCPGFPVASAGEAKQAGPVVSSR